MTEGFVSNWLWQNCQLERTIFGRSDRLVLIWIEKAIFITQRHDSLSFLVYDWFWHWIWMIIIFWLGYPWPTKPSAVILSYPFTSIFSYKKKIQLWPLRQPIEADMLCGLMTNEYKYKIQKKLKQKIIIPNALFPRPLLLCPFPPYSLNHTELIHRHLSHAHFLPDTYGIWAGSMRLTAACGSSMLFQVHQNKNISAREKHEQ